jgi:hypothetical protein
MSDRLSKMRTSQARKLGTVPPAPAEQPSASAPVPARKLSDAPDAQIANDLPMLPCPVDLAPNGTVQKRKKTHPHDPAFRFPSGTILTATYTASPAPSWHVCAVIGSLQLVADTTGLEHGYRRIFAMWRERQSTEAPKVEEKIDAV